MTIEATEPERGGAIAARLVPRAAAREYCISDSGIVIGSSESADVRDTDASVQPNHARLTREDGKWYLEDLNSASGTFLNGERIDGRVMVVHGDVVRCGTSGIELTCELVEHAAVEEPGGGIIHEVDQLRERAEVLAQELAARDARLQELTAEVGALNATLTSVQGELAHSREEHEAALAEVKHELARERSQLREVSALYDARVSELSQTQASIAELQQIIDAQQTRYDHG